jgi:acyl-CoA synthetase (AMP-forming)/AMP-acid ligase II
VRPGRAVAFAAQREGEERLVVACELNRRAKQPLPEIAEALRRAVAAEHGVLPDPVVALQPGELPRTSSGKPRRPLCRAMFLEGRLGERA